MLKPPSIRCIVDNGPNVIKPARATLVSLSPENRFSRAEQALGNALHGLDDAERKVGPHSIFEKLRDMAANVLGDGWTARSEHDRPGRSGR